MPVLAALLQTSGDVLADRLFGYACDTLAEGDLAAATDLLRQVIERVPTWVPAHMALGEAEERAGHALAAQQAFEQAATIDHTGLFGAALHVARLRGDPQPAMPAAYVAALFDGYAPRFNAHLVDQLSYRGPAAILDALRRAKVPLPAGHALDLGCGTGLMGAAIRPHVGQLDGVDLSSAMVTEARRTGLYDVLQVGSLDEALDHRDPDSLDLVLAADVLVYVGALGPVMERTARVLRPGGALAFTLQRGENREAVRLGHDLRFRHGEDGLRDTLTRAGLTVSLLDRTSTRRDAGADVPGLVAVARKP